MENNERYEQHLYESEMPWKIGVTSAKHSYISAHWHESTEILYFPPGRWNVICDGRRYNVSGGDIIVVNSGQIHAVERIEGEGSTYCLQISPEFPCTNHGFQNHIKNVPELEMYFENILNEYKMRNKGYEMAAMGNVCILLSHIQRNFHSEEYTMDNYTFSRREKIGNIIKFISENLEKKITTKTLCEEFFVSESHMCHFFKSQTGQSVTEYINRLKVEKSKILLKDTDMSVTDIAMQTGFEDSCYFTRVFKKYAEKTPLQYRKQSG